MIHTFTRFFRLTYQLNEYIDGNKYKMKNTKIEKKIHSHSAEKRHCEKKIGFHFSHNIDTV